MASWKVYLTWHDCTVYVHWFDGGSCSSWVVNTSNLGSVSSSLRRKTSSSLWSMNGYQWHLFWARGNTGMDHNLAQNRWKLRTSLPPKSRKGKWQILASAQLIMLIAWGAILIVWLQLSGTISSKFPSACIYPGGSLRFWTGGQLSLTPGQRIGKALPSRGVRGHAPPENFEIL